MARVVDLAVWRELVRVLVDLAEVGALAVEAHLSGDRDLLSDCQRWHEDRARRVRELARQLVA